jgi:hypothetical protein
MPWIPRIISQIISPQLNEISFSVFLDHVSDLVATDWLALDQLFVGSHFAHVQTLRVWIYGVRVEPAEVIASMAQILPHCHEGGILRVSCPHRLRRP